MKTTLDRGKIIKFTPNREVGYNPVWGSYNKYEIDITMSKINLSISEQGVKEFKKIMIRQFPLNEKDINKIRGKHWKDANYHGTEETREFWNNLAETINKNIEID